MANKETLKKISKATQFRSGSEAVINGTKGGIASGKARREKKLIKDRILERMNETDWDEMIDGVIARAKDADKAFEILRDTIGEKPTEKVNVFVEDESTREMDEYFAREYGEAAKD